MEHPAVYAAWQAPFVAQKFAPVERQLRARAAGARRRVRTRNECAALRQRRLRRRRHQRAISGRRARDTAAFHSGRSRDRGSVVARHVRHHPGEQLSASPPDRPQSESWRIVAAARARWHACTCSSWFFPSDHRREADGQAGSRSTTRRPVERWRELCRRAFRTARGRALCVRRRTLGNGVFPGAEANHAPLDRNPGLQRTGSRAGAAGEAAAGSRPLPAVRTRWSSSTTAAPTTRGAAEEAARRDSRIRVVIFLETSAIRRPLARRSITRPATPWS